MKPSFSRALANLLSACSHEGWKGASIALAGGVLAFATGAGADRLSQDVRTCYARVLAAEPGGSRYSAASVSVFGYRLPWGPCEEASVIERSDA
jgi:hypothetical protein